MKRLYFTSVLSFILLNVIFYSSAECGWGSPQKKADALIKACQRKDLDTIINSTWRYHYLLDDMKKRVPKFQQDRAASEIYASFKENDSILELFPAECDWKIIESRKNRLPLSIFGFGPDNWIVQEVFVSVVYRNPDVAPDSASGKRIKKTVIDLYFDDKTGYYIDNVFMLGEEVTWDVPSRAMMKKAEVERLRLAREKMLQEETAKKAREEAEADRLRIEQDRMQKEEAYKKEQEEQRKKREAYLKDKTARLNQLVGSWIYYEGQRTVGEIIIKVLSEETDSISISGRQYAAYSGKCRFNDLIRNLSYENYHGENRFNVSDKWISSTGRECNIALQQESDKKIKFELDCNDYCERGALVMMRSENKNN